MTSVQLKVRISQHSRDTLLFESFVKYWGAGLISKEPKNPVVAFSVVKLSDILNIVIPFFDKYPLHGKKRLDYEYFGKIAYLMRDKSHLTEKGLAQVREIKSGMNFGREEK